MRLKLAGVAFAEMAAALPSPMTSTSWTTPSAHPDESQDTEAEGVPDVDLAFADKVSIARLSSALSCRR